MQGYVALTSFTSEPKDIFGKRVTANHYVSKDVPAFKIEPYMTSEADYISQMNYSLSHVQAGGPAIEIMGSWEKFNELLLKNENFSAGIEKSGFLDDVVSKVTEGINEPERKPWLCQLYKAKF